MNTTEDFALVTALYRSSIDGRRFMYEAILDDKDNTYTLPDYFTSRTAEILQVRLKSLGIKIETITNEDEFIGEPEHICDVIEYQVGKGIIFCTTMQKYYLRKMHKVLSRYLLQHPNEIGDVDEIWDYIIENLPFKKKHLTDDIIKIFKDNIQLFSSEVLDE